MFLVFCSADCSSVSNIMVSIVRHNDSDDFFSAGTNRLDADGNPNHRLNQLLEKDSLFSTDIFKRSYEI